ncbi:DUF6461 domain-containing protein [Streptomyces radiopugnans]|nr:DUF6461 domain-containing protein [Streptomyces radiopugnans]
MTTPRGRVTEYGYDAAGNRTSVTTPLGEKATFIYDKAGRILSKTDPRGNAAGADPAAHTTSYAYDAVGRQVTAVDPRGNTTGADPARYTTPYGYDPAGNLTKTRHFAYTYDAAGQMLTRTYSGGSIAYTYDDDGRTSTMTAEARPPAVGGLGVRGAIGHGRAPFRAVSMSPAPPWRPARRPQRLPRGQGSARTALPQRRDKESQSGAGCRWRLGGWCHVGGADAGGRLRPARLSTKRDIGLPTQAAFALAERLTGVQVTRELLETAPFTGTLVDLPHP